MIGWLIIAVAIVTVAAVLGWWLEGTGRERWSAWLRN